MADSIAAKRIWAFHAGPMVGYFVGREEVGTNVAECVRADIVEALSADLARAVEALTEMCAAHDAIVAEQERVEKNGGKGWSSAPVIRSVYARNAGREFIASIKRQDNG